MGARQGSLTITVDLGRDDDPELADELISGLCEELRMLDVASVHRPSPGGAPPDTRGVAAVSVTDLILSGVFSAGTLGALTRVLTEWIRRCGARRVVLDEGGDRLEIHGLTRSDQRELVNAWVIRRAADAPRRAHGETDA